MKDGFPDGPFPDGYGLVGEPLEEGDLQIFALQPMCDGVERVFIIRVYDKDGKLCGESKPTLMHENRFGIDIEDFDILEAATNKLLMDISLGGGLNA